MLAFLLLNAWGIYFQRKAQDRTALAICIGAGLTLIGMVSILLIEHIGDRGILAGLPLLMAIGILVTAALLTYFLGRRSGQTLTWTESPPIDHHLMMVLGVLASAPMILVFAFSNYRLRSPWGPMFVMVGAMISALLGAWIRGPRWLWGVQSTFLLMAWFLQIFNWEGGLWLPAAICALLLRDHFQRSLWVFLFLHVGRSEHRLGDWRSHRGKRLPALASSS